MSLYHYNTKRHFGEYLAFIRSNLEDFSPLSSVFNPEIAQIYINKERMYKTFTVDTTDTDYIPFWAVLPGTNNIVSHNNVRNYAYDHLVRVLRVLGYTRSSANAICASFEDLRDIGGGREVLKLITAKLPSNIEYDTTALITNVEYMIENIDTLIDDSLLVSDVFTFIMQTREIIGNYYNAHQYLGMVNTSFSCHFFPKNKYLINHGCIIDADNGKVIAELRLKKEFLDYYLTAGPEYVSRDIFQLFIDREVANKTNSYPTGFYNWLNTGFLNFFADLERVIGDGKVAYNKLTENPRTVRKPKGPLIDAKFNEETFNELVEFTTSEDARKRLAIF